MVYQEAVENTVRIINLMKWSILTVADALRKAAILLQALVMILETALENDVPRITCLE